MHRHFTATAFVVDANNRVLLLWHKRLERWMPPGGHVDPNEMPEETARRECKEETGLDVEIIGEEQVNWFAENSHEGRMLKKPYALLLEEIPESTQRREPAHQHMDFVYRARLLDPSQTPVLQEEEGTQLRWFTKAEIEAMDAQRELYANVKHYALSLLGGSKEIGLPSARK